MNFAEKVSNFLMTINAKWPIYFVIGFLMFSFLLMFLIDVIGIFGAHEFLLESKEIPYFWYTWFTIPLENPLQWLLLGLTAVFFLMSAGINFYKKEKNSFGFYLLISLGVILMLIEDAGDVRHALRQTINNFIGDSGYGIFGTLFELGYFAIIAFIMLYAMVKFKAVYWRQMQARKYLLFGFVFYAIAVSASWLGSAFSGLLNRDLYSLIGEMLVNKLFLQNDLSGQIFEKAMNYTNVYHMLVDKVFEESFELLGVGFLLAAAIVLFQQVVKEN